MEEKKERKSWRDIVSSRNPDLDLEDDLAVGEFLDDSFKRYDDSESQRENLNKVLAEDSRAAGILTGLALAYVFRRPWLTCTGTVGILGVCMVLHGIYNLLITADGFWQMVGYFFPSAIIVTLFAARLLHRGRHTVFR